MFLSMTRRQSFPYRKKKKKEAFVFSTWRQIALSFDGRGNVYKEALKKKTPKTHREKKGEKMMGLEEERTELGFMLGGEKQEESET